MELNSLMFQFGEVAEKIRCLAKGAATRGRDTKQKYPLQVLAAIGMAALTTGILLRVWRSQI